MEYQRLIESIVYAVVDILDENDADNGDEDFDFDEWFDEHNVHDTMFEVVDSYVCGSWRKHMRIVLAAETSPEEVDTGLLGAEWQQSVGVLAFEVLRIDATERLREFKEEGQCFESGGVLPENNTLQLWFGGGGPVFALGDCFGRVHGVNTVISGSHISMSIRNYPNLIFEGTPFRGDPSDLYELGVGAPMCVRARRVYCGYSASPIADCDTHIQDILALALLEKWVKLVSYDADKHKSLLPLLPRD